MSLAARSAVVAALLACVAAGAVDVVAMDRVGVVAGVVLPVGALLAVLVFRAPLLGVQLALLAIPLEFFSLRVGGSAGLSPTEMLLLLTMAMTLVRWAVAGRVPPVPAPLRPIAVMCVLILVGYTVAEDKVVVTKILLMWTAFVIVAIQVASASARDTARVLRCLAIAGGLCGFVALAGGTDQSLVAGGLIATNRAQAGFAQPNVLGFFLVMAIPVALALTLRGGPLLRALMALMAAGAVAGLMLSLSRTSLVGTALGLSLLLLLAPFRRLAAVGIAALAVFALLNFQALQQSQQVAVVTKRIATLGERSVVGADPRLKIYRTTPQIIADHPILGVGEGNFSRAAARYNLLDPANQEPFDHAHDVALTFAAELGIPGLIVFVWFVVVLAGFVRRAVAARGDPKVGTQLLAVAAGLVGMIVTSAGDYPPRTNAIAATFLILVGLLVALLRQAETDR